MKKIRKSNIAGEILFLFGIIILWQIFYVAGVDGLGIWKAYAMPSPVGVWREHYLLQLETVFSEVRLDTFFHL